MDHHFMFLNYFVDPNVKVLCIFDRRHFKTYDTRDAASYFQFAVSTRNAQFNQHKKAQISK